MFRPTAFRKLWPSAEFLAQQLPPKANRFALGWHPTRAAAFFDPTKRSKNRAKFQELLGLENCIAVGEIGLDYEWEQRPFWQEKQGEMLQWLVQHALDNQKPLLFHLRDPDNESPATIRDPDNESSAVIRCRNLLLEMAVPKSYPIYLHCYSYGWREFGIWLSRFDNVILGLAPKVIKDPNPDLKQLIRDIDPHRYVLETDAPILLYPRLSKVWGSRPDIPGGQIRSSREGQELLGGANPPRCYQQRPPFLRILVGLGLRPRAIPCI